MIGRNFSQRLWLQDVCGEPITANALRRKIVSGRIRGKFRIACVWRNGMSNQRAFRSAAAAMRTFGSENR